MRTRQFLAVAVAGASVVLSASGAFGAHSAQSAYVVQDTGKPTENADVNDDSSCDTPDVADTQEIGMFSDKSNNVHVDGCIYDAEGGFIDTQVSFDYAGVGGIAACPDADADGPKTATTADRDSNGTPDLCTHTGYEADNLQYHVRVLSESAGDATVTMCTDPEGNGCGDADLTSVISLTYQQTLPETGAGLLVLGAAGTSMIGAGAFRLRRRR